jgi:hypothetical protein
MLNEILDSEIRFEMTDESDGEKSVKLWDSIYVEATQRHTAVMNPNGENVFYAALYEMRKDFRRIGGIKWIIKKDDPENPSGITGKFPKRFANFIKKNYDAKVAPDILEFIGNEYEKIVLRKRVWIFDFTRTITWDAGDFGDGRSCFFASRQDNLDLIGNRGFAVRFYEKDVWGRPVGKARAWVAEDFPRAGEITVWNAYGYHLHKIADVLQGYFGFKLCKEISLRNHGETDGHFYINDGTAYVISNEHLPHSRYDLHWGNEDRCLYRYQRTQNNLVATIDRIFANLFAETVEEVS